MEWGRGNISSWKLGIQVEFWFDVGSGYAEVWIGSAKGETSS